MIKRRAIEMSKKSIVPLCVAAAKQIVSEVPSVRASSFEGPVGSLTTYDGYHCGIECVFESVLPSGEDLLSLTVDIGTRDNLDEVSLSICWGSGRIVEGLFLDHMPLSEAAMAEVIAAFPRFSGALASEARAAVHDA